MSIEYGLVFTFFFGAIQYSIFDFYFVQITLSHFSKFKIIVGTSLPHRDSMKPAVSTLNFLKEQRMRFAGNGELHYLLFSILYFFSNPFTSVPFLHHFPAIFT